MSIRPMFAASVALAALFAVATPSLAGFDGGSGGNSDYQDSLTGDLQKNPRLIEPGAQNQRYLEYYGSEGYDRRAAAYYGQRGYPNVRVRSYNGSGY